MSLAYIHQHVIPCALNLLPWKMDTPEARAMILAIGQIESGFQYRRQIGGPAHGYFQFERDGGIKGVLQHKETRGYIRTVLDAMGYSHLPEASHLAIVDNDILAVVYARLLLWSHPKALPTRVETNYAATYYVELWRPGKPRLHAWPDAFQIAWAAVVA